ncbi:AUX/IAA protein [Trema orientale]|uniref:Auxin-responsive protein n=1 Tax=Trema orientale TaxID=63057 RepID=A0A2P5ESL2_TREOI|nr:AUX/IAA protein [Trema orientale]
MEGSSRREEVCPQLLDLIPQNREWLVNRDKERSHGSSEEKKLELRLGPPGQDWPLKGNNRERDESLLSLGYFSPMASGTHNTSNINNSGNQGSVLSFSPWSSSGKFQQQQGKAPTTSFLQSLPVAKEGSQPCCPTKVVDLQNAEKKAFSPAATPSPAPPAGTAVPNSSQKRTAPAPVVGWPPIRSFRKNLASTSSSSKPSTESQSHIQNKIPGEKKPLETIRKGLFVKINMDGVPIGRKVDLKAFDSYEKLSSAVDELFRGLLAAQRDSSAQGIQNNQEEEKAITGLLDGSGEYTLVYEDNEGDRMLVGDVPWHMFVSTVKRLRVLKSSELSALSLVSSKQDQMRLDSSLK